MLYLVYVLGNGLSKILPLKACYFIADIVALCYYAFSKKDKAEIKANLKVVLGENADEKKLNGYVFEVFRNFGKYLADFVKTRKFTMEEILRDFDIEGQENLDKALSYGRGVIALTMHFGNWELSGSIMAGLGYPTSAIILEHKDRRINDFFVKRRALNGLRSIPLGASVKGCFKALKRNEMVGIVGDKDYTSGGVPINFFGRQAIVPKGAAAIALKTGAAIVISILFRQEDDSFKYVFEEPIVYKPTGDEDADIRAIMALYFASFEKYIRRYPGQWYAFKKIWI